MELDACAFFSSLGRVAGQSLVTRFTPAPTDAEDPNDQVVEPNHRSKYREPNWDERRGITHDVILVKREWVERILGNGPRMHSHDHILLQNGRREALPRRNHKRATYRREQQRKQGSIGEATSPRADSRRRESECEKVGPAFFEISHPTRKREATCDPDEPAKTRQRVNLVQWR